MHIPLAVKFKFRFHIILLCLPIPYPYNRSNPQVHPHRNLRSILAGTVFTLSTQIAAVHEPARIHSWFPLGF